jgi:hypothetical protein
MNANRNLKFSSDSHTGHANDVIIGKAKVCYNEFKQIWVAPGGGFIFTKQRAETFCNKLNKIMCGK